MKIHIDQILDPQPHLNRVGQMVQATKAIQRAVLGLEPQVAEQPVDTDPDTAATAHAPGTFTRVALRHNDVLRHYKIFVPTTASPPLMLVVMLHGCMQSPDDFAAGTGMNMLASQQGFLVMYPEQTRTSSSKRCWNWFRPENQLRGSGEAALLAAMVRDAMHHHRVDPDRVFVAGLSAGGAMAAVLAQQYPDLFSAVGVHSGVMAGGAHDVMSAFSAMKSGAKKHLPALLAKQIPAAPPTIIFHGDTDTTVHPTNGDQLIKAAIHALSPDEVQCRMERREPTQGKAFTRMTYHTAQGTAAEHWVVHGSGHAWSGGSTAGSYTDPQGPDASAHMVRFFMEHPRHKTSILPLPTHAK